MLNFTYFRVDSVMKQFIADSGPQASTSAQDDATSRPHPKPLTPMCDRVSNAEVSLVRYFKRIVSSILNLAIFILSVHI